MGPEQLIIMHPPNCAADGMRPLRPSNDNPHCFERCIGSSRLEPARSGRPVSVLQLRASAAAMEPTVASHLIRRSARGVCSLYTEVCLTRETRATGP